MARAEPEGYVRIFVDEGLSNQELAARLYLWYMWTWPELSAASRP
ncbi:hypothetical protein [Oscillochloris sp. ZM17-4]|nr:hypothetical protein [Oscillochloris sp. ZM17-4]